jgi:hypothetical protein
MKNKLRTVNGGHAKHSCVGVLEMFEAGEGVVARGSSVPASMKSGLWVFKNLLEGTFNCKVWGVD